MGNTDEHDDENHYVDGKPAGVLIGFEDEDAWFEYKLELDPRFLNRIAESRQGFREGKYARLEDINWDEEEHIDKPFPSA